MATILAGGSGWSPPLEPFFRLDAAREGGTLEAWPSLDWACSDGTELCTAAISGVPGSRWLATVSGPDGRAAQAGDAVAVEAAACAACFRRRDAKLYSAAGKRRGSW